MSIVVSGSIAQDYIMNFHDQFGNYILPESTNNLSVSFNISELKVHAGWAGHNVAYSLGLLGEKACLFGAAGKERSPPAGNTDMIDYTYTHISETLGTPAAHIITDDQNNQITGFYPGASMEASQQSIHDAPDNCTHAIISPNAPDAMLKHCREADEKGMTVIFDPGQPLSAFSTEQLHEVAGYADFLIVNEYEHSLFCKISGRSPEQLREQFATIIVTHGADGSDLYHDGEHTHVAALPAPTVADPTGAGDSFRAGLLRAIYHGHPVTTGMQIGSICARHCIQHHGTQEHRFTLDQVKALATQHYDTTL